MGAINIWILVWVIELIICCGLALWRGGPVERIGAAIIFVGWVLSAILQDRSGHNPGDWVVVIDVAALLAFAFLSVWSRRLWTVFAMACQFMGVVSHFAQEFSNFGWVNYMTALGIWSGDALVACVIAGVIGYRFALQRNARMEAAGVDVPNPRRRQI